jgi:hypothetical protein
MAFQLIPFAVDLLVASAISVGASYLAAAFIKKPSQDAPGFGNLPTQTSLKGIPIPIVYGTRRVAGNVIWHQNAGYTKGSDGISYFFHHAVIALCEGPATVLRA